MFKFLGNKSDMRIYSPVVGKMVKIEEVPDKTFADKLLGDGVAFYADTDTISSPCSGKVTMIANTKHAIGILSDNGVELLIHIGLETVNLQGEGFEVLVRSNEKVKAGTPLIKVDRKLMESKNINLVIPMVITNDMEVTKNLLETVDTSSVVMQVQ
ncbi:PTS glucose transporter subunit IIA [Anaerocolumna sp. AGMB13025]|uniref:PTS sugar transporter subunit IIA n=1 Tax=Anaerocolumna sp. AGMB13025 TaxID=3039116 RepID=UPI00241D0B32|nr:PTS glucose transporter subunit IIA [Anaerocolumna sp. AGMB13025]WFR55771.1 PTS glucose transporter subunit IIA [Anaerocolumna sp. AGMB13025]